MLANPAGPNLDAYLARPLSADVCVMMIQLQLEAYQNQIARWPTSGHHILAQYDEQYVVVYQAFGPAIGHYAAHHGHFGPGFGLNRMSWIKPNFLWMMYRSGWGTKENQDCVLAIWLTRLAFDAIVQQAVPSSYDPERYTDRAAWQQAVAQSSVRVQWDPDHDPTGRRVERRAIQLGLRSDVLAQYAQGDWIAHIADISGLVAIQGEYACSGDYERLMTPTERVYLPSVTSS